MNRRLIFVFAAIALVTSCGVQSETTSDNGPEESTTTTERPPERDRTSSTSTSIDVSSPFDEVLRSYAPDRAEASTVIPTYEASTSTPEEEMLTFSQFVVGNLDKAEVTVTITRLDTNKGETFKLAGGAEVEKCLDPGSYTYTLDAPPPWNSVNGELNVQAGDAFLWPIQGE